jgi:CheY-like chemotaxis protein
MDGIEAADAIRALGTEYAQKLPIIALTANAIQGTEKMFYEHGFQAFISKPIDIMEMDSVIRKWVRKESLEKASVPDVPAPDAPASVSPASAAPDDDADEEIVIPEVDTEKGISLYGGEMDIYLQVLRSFAANTSRILDRLRIVSPETLSDYVIAVHGLKGASAGIGAQAVSGAAMNLEAMSRAGDLDGVLARNDKLIKDTEAVVANIKSWLAKYDARKIKPRLKTPARELLERLRQSCESFDMSGIDQAMSELESADYEEGADLMAWLKEKIDISEIAEVAERLREYAAAERETG